MKKTVSVYLSSLCSLFFILFILSGSLLAAETIKFGSVDIQKVLNESEAGKKAKSDLETLIKSKQAVIDEKGKVLEKIKSDLEKQSAVLSADARKNKEDELEKLAREYQRFVQDSQAEVKKKEGELTDEILKEIREIIDKTGEEEGYTLIIERGSILYAYKGTDISDTILKKYGESKARLKK